MRAAWYEKQGAAGEVLVFGEMPDPVLEAGEVRIRVRASGVNPGEIKKRQGWLGSGMPYPRVVPHSDGAERSIQWVLTWTNRVSASGCGASARNRIAPSVPQRSM